MKELNIEEKAKLYDKALERAMDCQFDGLASQHPVREVIEYIFPELKEDERIKSCIKMCLTDADERRFNDYKISLSDCLAWLEKQNN